MTMQCFVAGSPIRFSRSPLIHGHWIDQRSLDATYVRLEITPAELPALIAKVRDGTYLGGNLTIPLKQLVIPLLDEITNEARAMGAVNTIFMRDGRVTGANTDVAGFFAHLDATCPGWDASPASVLVLGAGGAASAIVHGLLSRNVSDIRVANRSPERLEALLEHMRAIHPRGSVVTAASWPVAPKDIAASGLIINSTSLGMTGQPPLELEWPTSLEHGIAYDIVYTPLVTSFLHDARARGARGVDGLGMLLHQAAFAFSHWFGTTPVVTSDLRSLIEADLMPATR